MPRHPRELSTTSYALLGLLAARRDGWSAYELAKQMKRSLDYVWPRAQRNLYDEVKLLAERKLASTRLEHVGRRPRTIYTITPEGRRSLRAWLAQPSAPATLEAEALVRVFFADQGTLDDLRAAIQSIRVEAEETERQVATIVADYASDGGPFPERLHVTALMAKLLFSHREALRAWATWAETEIDSWTSTRLGHGAHLPAEVFEEITATADKLSS